MATTHSKSRDTAALKAVVLVTALYAGALLLFFEVVVATREVVSSSFDVVARSAVQGDRDPLQTLEFVSVGWSSQRKFSTLGQSLRAREHVRTQ